MRGIAIYDDKVFAATSDARLVALDARTGKTVWQTTIGDRSKGNYRTSSGPIVAKGKLIQGWAAARPTAKRNASSAPTTPPPAKSCGGSTRLRSRASPAEIPGAAAHESVPRRRRVVDHRQLRSRSESHLLGNGAGQTVDADQPRHVDQRRCALHQLDAGVGCRHRQARLALPARAGGIAGPRRRVRALARRRRQSESGVHRRQGRHPLEAGSEDRQVPRPQGNRVPERLGAVRSPDRQALLSVGHPRTALRRMDARLPEHRRRPQLAGVEPSRRHQRSSSFRSARAVIEISAQRVEQKEGGGSGGGAGRRFYEMPGSDGNIGKLAPST